MQLRLEVNTPVVVLARAEGLVEGVDYVYRGGKVHIFDVVKLADQFKSFDELVKAVAAAPERYASESLPSPPIPPKTELKVSGPVPPSSVKGLLRTAYLYYKLKRDADLFQNFVKAVEDSLGLQPKYVASSAERLVFVKAAGEGRVYDVFNTVLVQTVEASPRYGVYKIEVWAGRSVSASFYAKALAPGSAFVYRVDLVRRPGAEGPTEDELKAALEEFSSDLSQFEKKRGVYVPSCKALRVGLGAGRRWKTVLNLLTQLPIYAQLEQKMSKLYKRQWGDLSVKYATDGANKWPVGWVCYDVS